MNGKTNKDQILKMDNVFDYNEYYGLETLHPLVNVVDFSTFSPQRHRLYCAGFYAVFLKDVKCGDLIYGRQTYDYQEGTVVCVAPGQVFGAKDTGETFQPKGWALVFHPDLLRGTSLGKNIRNYTFFSYQSREALHLSEQERRTVVDCFRNILHELQRPVDRHSRTLIVGNIEMLLNYCIRFYDRQFITRSNIAGKDILVRFEELLHTYFATDKPQTIGVPTVQYCASELHLSPNYFGDLIKKETGKTAQEYIQQLIIDTAKEKIFDHRLTIGQIAYELGFKYPAHFTRLFKNVVGVTPNQYRAAN